MRFRLLDEIVEFEPGASITARKWLRPEEDYLKDHFPKFPVMPGVLMLEAMFQASAWLVRKSEDFANPVVLLKEARNVKYADFVAPDQTLTVTAEIIKQDEQLTTIKGQGTLDDSVAVSGRLVLERFKLADRYPIHSNVDPHSRHNLRAEFDRLWNPA
ncbi:MAG: beta-hydroxyacyl-ACP dehydratase [Planctomycetaceae bacterium]|nr:beta-hydroxyacyl-ACP dehydratase [Planctomycetaceae bacterium]